MTEIRDRDRFIAENLGLVHACAGRFKGKGIEYEELYASGCLGLIKAYDAFDWNRGVCFSTYAVPVILGEIKKLFRDGGTVKVSRSLKELGLKINAVQEKISKEKGKAPTLAEVAKILGVEEEQAALAVKAGLPALSLTPAGEEEERQIDLPVNSPEEVLNDRLALRQELKQLNREDALLIEMRFFQEKTQSQTAALLGATQVQISRRERKILRQLRDRLV